jgi:glycosyltransferase involved in cell wall biosynthesis
MRLQTGARIVPARDLPAPASRGTSGVVIFAPNLQEPDLAIYKFALSSLRLPVNVVTGAGLDREELLANAACVIDASASDPSWAIALARRGYRLAVSATSGAIEYMSNAAVYDPVDERSILRATLAALGAEAAHAFSVPSLRDVVAAIEASAPPELDAPPLVSVVIPTYNRHIDLREAVRSLLAQNYPHIEIIVVNDGGQPVGDTFAGESHVRVFDRDVNVGAFGAENFGILQARGKYVQLLADDDILYPDHVARLVAALEHSGACIAHGNVLIRYERVGQNGIRELDGFNASVFVSALDPFNALISTPIAGQALMIRRDVYERFGTFDVECTLADQEHQMRIAREFDFVHVNRITGEWRVRDSGDAFSSNKNEEFAASLEKIYARMPSGRPAVEAARRATILNVRNRAPGYVFPPSISFRR